MDTEHIKALEERKRDAAYDPKARWLHIQQTITWAEANLPEHLRRNRPRVCEHDADHKGLSQPSLNS